MPVTADGSPGDPYRGLSAEFLCDQFIALIGAKDNPSLTINEAQTAVRNLSTGSCARDGREGSVYADVAPDPNAGLSKFFLSVSCDAKIQDATAALSTYCEGKHISQAEVRVWFCLVCWNQHRLKEACDRGDS
eukprot:gnl/TRDRNA2_/TRDRNA2_148932_c0_seq1.p1 gnl/TRDRNA2_/TRDRNA2_148932_c0~~gnl/TRDRNA2_/TRDRNA2_148932_c0_seq1.p1  ORF type:complete len:149 (-),score=12.27 gnl/TRDRNA2_/TRDRNA2_148932_c0_seq1:15-413(-)